MAKKKSKSFTKHVYSIIAVVVLLVAAGIASYATAPAGSATHATIYTDKIEKLGAGSFIDVANGVLNVNQGLKAISGYDDYAVSGQGTVGVVGFNVAGTNRGTLGTNAQGVAGIASSGIGVYGEGPTGVEGRNLGCVGSFGRIGTSTYAVYGETACSIGVAGKGGVAGVQGRNWDDSNTGRLGTLGAGVRGETTNPTVYGGYFTGGLGLWTSKIDFGASAFDESDGKGFLILGSRVGMGCTTVCLGHGLGCVTSFEISGTPGTERPCAYVGQNRQCFCGQA